MTNISLSFPDGSIRDYQQNITGYQLANNIAKSLAKKAVAYLLDNHIYDLHDPISCSGNIEFITRDHPRALELIRHDCAHILAQAVKILFPDTQIAIGPTIENGFYYDFARDVPFTLADLSIIEKKMHEIVKQNQAFKKEIWSKEKAKEIFAAKGEAYKLELLDSIPDEEDVKIYFNGDWFDLCRGPHMTTTGQVGHSFKLTKVAGAYWRGDSNNPMLTRIYGVAFANEDNLNEYLHMLEEAEKRDHRRLGREMSLFHLQEEGPGVIFWHPNGWKIFQNLISYARRRLESLGYQEVNAPQILDKSLWEASGHWEWYRENMFKVTCAGDDADDMRQYVLKPMNCPGHAQIFKYGLKSYRDLPLRLSEFGKVHRYEPSGSLHGIMRVRGFTQDDAHVFCTEEQMAAEFLHINDLILSCYADMGFHNITVKLSTRPLKKVGSDEVWDHAEKLMADVLKIIEQQSENKIKIEIFPGEGAFYGPKFEYTLKDAIGREWQCGTTQLDFNLPERFGIFYIDKNSEKKVPVMIHRAIFGSMERFLGILLEHYAGNLPLWLAPVQVVVANIAETSEDYAAEVFAKLQALGVEVEFDNRNEKINYKIREHSLKKVPIILICGKKEAEENNVNLRYLGSQETKIMALDQFLDQIKIDILPPDLKN
ncbi:threonine--tRNA ligase [Bartonella sp. DGB1]|uniref:threonine--tRNA ligase n=1 Tax=Bartonella sp. DGB1 TaxID=3239807 RepID=UPI003526B418